MIAFSGIDATSGEGDATAEVNGSSVPAVAEYDALVNAIEGDAEIERNDALLSPAPYQ